MEKSKLQTYFLRLLEPHLQSLSDYCRSVEQNEEQAKDLLQDTLLVALENVDKLKDPSAFRYYLFGIAGRLSKKNYRKQKRMTCWNDSLNESLESHQSQPGAQHDVELLYKALNRLPDAMRIAIVLFEINGFSIQEICKIQGSSTPAVKSRLKRGREKLAKLLNDK